MMRQESLSIVATGRVVTSLLAAYGFGRTGVYMDIAGHRYDHTAKRLVVVAHTGNLGMNVPRLLARAKSLMCCESLKGRLEQFISFFPRNPLLASSRLV